jgi:hypothetical protein
MAAVPPLLRNGANVDHLISIFTNPEQPAGCKDSATSQQPCSSNSKQQQPSRLQGDCKSPPPAAVGAAAAAIAAANETAAKHSARSQRAPNSDSQQQQGGTVLAYQITPINLLSGAALAQPQVLSGNAAIALHTLLIKLNAQRLQEQLKEEQQQQATAQHSEVKQQQQLPAVKHEVVDAAAGQAPGATQAEQQQQQNPLAALQAALAAAGRAAVTADLQETLSQLQSDAWGEKDALALLPQQVLQQGPAAMVEQLQQYIELQQRLDSRQQQQQGLGASEVNAGQAQQMPAAGRSTLGLDRIGSGASSSSCSDPLQQQQQQAGKHRSVGAAGGAGKAKQGVLLGPGQHSWPAAAARGPAAATTDKSCRWDACGVYRYYVCAIKLTCWLKFFAVDNI